MAGSRYRWSFGPRRLQPVVVSPVLTMRWAWLLFGLSTQALFIVLIVSLMWFMHLGAATVAIDGTQIWSAAVIDMVLICLFAVSHSVLLIPRIRRSFTALIPAPLYGCLFCLVSCLSLWSLMYWWHPLPGVWWQYDGYWWWTIMTLAAGAWILLAYSMWITGLGHQTGLTGLMAYWRPHRAQPRSFQTRGLYRYFRHPIYLSFFLIVWLTPVMSTGHLMLSVLMTSYLLIGSWLKDRRLVQLIGEPYQRYMATVPGYPGFSWWENNVSSTRFQRIAPDKIHRPGNIPATAKSDRE